MVEHSMNKLAKAEHASAEHEAENELVSEAMQKTHSIQAQAATDKPRLAGNQASLTFLEQPQSTIEENQFLQQSVALNRAAELPEKNLNLSLLPLEDHSKKASPNAIANKDVPEQQHATIEEQHYRSKVKGTDCLCQLDWVFLTDFKCTKDYFGCCNPTGDAHGAFCPISGKLNQGPKCLNQTKEYGRCDPVSKKQGPCNPWWRLGESSECPYGLALPGDVTLPRPLTFLKSVAVFYGYIPYFLSALIFIEALYRRTLRTLGLFFFICVSVFLGELIFKRIVTSPRPAMSCLHSCGMPSSHSTLAFLFFTLMILDALYIQGHGGRGGSFKRSLATVVPLLPATKIESRQFSIWVLVWFCVLIPVPVTRVLLRDHTPSQVLIGMCIGMCEGIVFYRILQWVAHSYMFNKPLPHSTPLHPEVGLVACSGRLLIRNDRVQTSMDPGQENQT